MRPDRIAVTYRNVTFEGDAAESTFQVEIFRGGRTLRTGSFRLSWLSVGASSGTLGISGDRPADTGGADFCASVSSYLKAGRGGGDSPALVPTEVTLLVSAWH